MAIHWKIPFKSLRTDTLYTVNIYDDSYSGSPVQLMGAAEPFVTQEDDSDDMFIPVRTQTGYIRIVDNGKDANGRTLAAADRWDKMLPATNKSRKVTLTNGSGNIVWQGWMQPQTFSGQLYEDVQEREFPVMCGLLALDGAYPTVSQFSGLVNFAALLYGALHASGMSIDKIYFSGIDALYWLLRRVNWENMIQSDNSQSRRMAYNWREILEAVCQYWGWTCRTFGRNVYFIIPEEHFSPQLVSIDEQSLYLMSQDVTPQYYSEYEHFIDTDDEIYTSVDNSIEILQGRSEVKVTADINRKDVILSVPFSDIMDKFRNGAVTYTKDYTNLYHFIKNNPDGGQYVHTYDNDSVSITCYWDQGRLSGFRCQELWQSPDGTFNSKHNFNWDCDFYTDGSGNYDDAPMTLVSKSAHAFSNGVITINGKSTDAIVAYLRVGNKCWNGSAWVNVPIQDHPYFTLYTNSQTAGEIGNIADNRELLSNYDAYTGYGIPVGNDGLSGIFEFRVLGSPQSQSFKITELEIGFAMLQSSALENDNNANEYVAESSQSFNGKEEIKLIFATSNNNKYGYGLVMEPYGGYMQNALYTSADGTIYEKPEEHLLARMLNRYKKIKKKEIIDVNARINIDPITWCETLNMSGYAAAIERHWRDDMERITILET